MCSKQVLSILIDLFTNCDYSQLIHEIGKYDEERVAEDDQTSLKRLKDYKKTSMKKGVGIFEEFVRKLEDTWKGKHIKIEASGKCEVQSCQDHWYFDLVIYLILFYVPDATLKF